MECSICGKKAITFIRYSGNSLCPMHFNEFVEDRVKKEMRRQCHLGKNEVIAVAVSGGKDSTTTLCLMKRFFEDRRGTEIIALTVDEGIRGYRDGTIRVAERNCRSWGIEHHIASFKEVIGYTMDEISKMRRLACSYCGVFRRKCLNLMAKEVGATRLATGLNLDDTAQSIIMNIARGDVQKLTRIGPHKKVQEGLVPRLQPLRLIPEKEVFLYALLNRIEFHHGTCPYAEAAARNRFRDVINALERDMPGTRHAILKSHDEIAEPLSEFYPQAELNRCRLCGEPTGDDMCRACAMKLELMKAEKNIGLTKKNTRSSFSNQSLSPSPPLSR